MDMIKLINEFGPAPSYLKDKMADELPALLQPAMEFIESVYLDSDRELGTLSAADRVFQHLTENIREKHRPKDMEDSSAGEYGYDDERHDEINYGVEDDERPVKDEMNESIEKLKSQFNRFLIK